MADEIDSLEYNLHGDYSDLIDDEIINEGRTLVPLIIDSTKYLSISPEFGLPVDVENRKIRNPRQLILSNIWCWSKLADFPICETTMYLDSNKEYRFKEGSVSTRNNEYNGNTIDVFFVKDEKEVLITNFDYNDIKLTEFLNALEKPILIKTFKKEEKSKGWILFNSMFYLAPAFVGSIAIETIVYAITDKFRWSRIGLYTAGTIGGVAVYKLYKWENYTKIRIVNITF